MIYDSIIAIKEFENDNNIVNKEGQFFVAHVTAFINNACVFCGNIDCMLSYDFGYEQYSITIDWLLGEKSIKEKGLHGAYNTNFQDFIYDGNELKIIDKNTEIIISL